MLMKLTTGEKPEAFVVLLLIFLLCFWDATNENKGKKTNLASFRD